MARPDPHVVFVRRVTPRVLGFCEDCMAVGSR